LPSDSGDSGGASRRGKTSAQEPDDGRKRQEEQDSKGPPHGDDQAAQPEEDEQPEPEGWPAPPVADERAGRHGDGDDGRQGPDPCRRLQTLAESEEDVEEHVVGDFSDDAGEIQRDHPQHRESEPTGAARVSTSLRGLVHEPFPDRSSVTHTVS
jgi:hypothetical protein